MLHILAKIQRIGIVTEPLPPSAGCPPTPWT